MQHIFKTCVLPTVKPIDEQELVRACLKNDRKAQKELYDHFAPIMLGVCCRYANSKEEGEDILIEGFSKVFVHLEDFHFECSLSTWIRKIMVNTAISFFRMHHKHHNQFSLDEAFEEDFTVAQGSPADGMMENDLLKLIQRMPETYRVIFNLFVVEGLSHQEIGTTLGIQECTSRSQLVRAKNWLKERINR